MTKNGIKWRKNSETLKAPKLFGKTYFQMKVNKSGRCYNLGTERIPC